MKVLGIIPARYASSRFPAKVLANLGGKSVLQRVWEQSQKANLLNRVYIATDHEKVAEHAKSFGAEVLMTQENHPSGTDRIAEALQLSGESCDVLINIQGDEPFIQPELIDQLAQEFTDAKVDICTAAVPIAKQEDISNPNVVKVVQNHAGNALYFSRSPVPFIRNHPKENWLNQASFFRHMGIYAYRQKVLKAIVQLPESMLEKAERLEQLRWLEAGYTIRIIQTNDEGIGIDEPKDLDKALKFLNLQRR